MKGLDKLQNIQLFKILKYITQGVKFVWKEYHFKIPHDVCSIYFNMLKEFVFHKSNLLDPMNDKQYRKWISIFEKKSSYEKLAYEPLISIIVSVYNTSDEFLHRCLNLLENQTYKNYEIYLIVENSLDIKTIEILKNHEKKDRRIKIVYNEKKIYLWETLNSVICKVNGKYIVLMDNSVFVKQDALYEMIKALNKDSKIEMIYTDNDVLNFKGKRCKPNFKSDFAPDTLLSNNYIGKFSLLRKDSVTQIGGFRPKYTSAMDYDLYLRLVETTNHIIHIPKILYHLGTNLKKDENESNNYLIANEKKVLEDTLKRRKINGDVLVYKDINYFIIDYKNEEEPLVSILIPTRDYADILEDCLKSVYEKTEYKNFEVIILDNQSQDKATFDLFKKYSKNYKNFKVIKVDEEFNFSHICNVGVENSEGEYIVLLNNDTKVITKRWLNIMLGYAMQKHIGTVGVKLLYPDNSIQHAGIIAGLNGVAYHAFVGYKDDEFGFYGKLAVPYNYSANTAACFMISKEKYLKVNGFEESLPVEYNDVDFNFKLLDNNYYNICLPHVKLYHYESKTRGYKIAKEKLEASNYMYKKWNKYIKNDPFYNRNLSLYEFYKLNKKTIV